MSIVHALSLEHQSKGLNIDSLLVLEHLCRHCCNIPPEVFCLSGRNNVQVSVNSERDFKGLHLLWKAFPLKWSWTHVKIFQRNRDGVFGQQWLLAKHLSCSGSFYHATWVPFENIVWQGVVKPQIIKIHILRVYTGKILVNWGKCYANYHL